MIKSINPANGEEIKSYPEMDKEEINRILINADKTFNEWKETTFPFRAERMNAAAEALRKNKEELSRLMTMEMGKPISQSRGEIEKCAWVCNYYAENAEKFLTDEIVDTDAANSFITYRPIGVILAIMPWNFPFWQVFRFAAPNLMAGNAGVLKHSSNVTGCALAIENIFSISCKSVALPSGFCSAWTTSVIRSFILVSVIFSLPFFSFGKASSRDIGLPLLLLESRYNLPSLPFETYIL